MHAQVCSVKLILHEGNKTSLYYKLRLARRIFRGQEYLVLVRTECNISKLARRKAWVPRQGADP
jgi:hypothetical protein